VARCRLACMANFDTAPSAEAWLRHVERWRESGLTVPAYCREHGLEVGAMRYQIRRAPQPPTTAIRLARVVRTAPTPVEPVSDAAVVIEIGPARIRVERGVDAATLTTVLVALGARP
jgi:hypothetical protein